MGKICGKECVSSRGLKRDETLKHTRKGTSKIEEKPKETVSATLQISQFEKIVKECANLCHGHSCLPEDIRNMYDSFEFGRQDAVDLWEILEPVNTRSHGDAKKICCSFYGLLQDNLLPNKFGGDINLTNILLAEIGNDLLSFLASQNASYMKIEYTKNNFSERSETFTVYCWLYSS